MGAGKSAQRCDGKRRKMVASAKGSTQVKVWEVIGAQLGW